MEYDVKGKTSDNLVTIDFSGHMRRDTHCITGVLTHNERKRIVIGYSKDDITGFLSFGNHSVGVYAFESDIVGHLFSGKFSPHQTLDVKTIRGQFKVENILHARRKGEEQYWLSHGIQTSSLNIIRDTLPESLLQQVLDNGEFKAEMEQIN
jgi:hypothetical protein